MIRTCIHEHTQNCPHTDAHWPVVVEMTQLVSESLYVVRLETRCVIDDVEAGGCDCPLANRLTHKEEVIPGEREGKNHS